MLCAQQGPRFRLLGSEGGFTKHGIDPQEPYIVAGGSPLDAEYGVEDTDWAGLLGRDGHLDRAAHRARRLPGVLPDPGGQDHRRRSGLARCPSR